MQVNETPLSPKNVISHMAEPTSLADNIQELTDKIRARGDLPHTSVEEQLEVLEELSTFSFGRFLIQNRGLNGYWTDILLMYPDQKNEDGLNLDGEPMGDLERFIFERAPTALATQERFRIFRDEAQKRLVDGATLVSVPSGVMGDLLTLNYDHVSDISLVGVDIDLESLQYAEQRSKECGFEGKTSFLKEDAWKFNLEVPADVLTSNGLNIYEPDENRVVDLYRQFYRNIKPGGVLITSFLTPPPIPGSASEWKLDKINPEDGRRQRVLFVDVLGAAWQSYTSTEKSIEQLKSAGFIDIQVIEGEAGIFPTVVAKRPSN